MQFPFSIIFFFVPPVILLLPTTFAKKICPSEHKYGPGPPGDKNCAGPTDPNNRPPSELEKWFSEEMFNDLFPFANLGWGPQKCLPYSYQSFVIAARYFPRFGAESPPKNGYNFVENTRRDVAAFFAHAVQETGMNDISLYSRAQGTSMNVSEADDCFYRGGLFNWFEGGPVSAFLDPSSPGNQPSDGDSCLPSGRYCSPSLFFPCGNGTVDGGGGKQQKQQYFGSCYFGRGPIQISYNYNYGQFNNWLLSQNITGVDLLAQPNLVLTKMDPPLALLASLWFYMTPQPPKPAMHDIVLGRWKAGAENEALGYSGPIFGPTSLIINNECTGEDAIAPGGGGENRRIRAFKWFCRQWGVPAGSEKTLTCKNMPKKFDQMPQNVSWEPDWSSTWRADKKCQCAPASYGGVVPFYQSGFYPDHFVQENAKNGLKCQKLLYEYPSAFGLDLSTSGCLNYTKTTTENKNNNGTAEGGRNNKTNGKMATKEINIISEQQQKKKIVEGKKNEKTTKRVVSAAAAKMSSEINYLHPDISKVLLGVGRGV